MAENQIIKTFKAGFVAGTLVHTKQGLRSIDQIKVGDYVLSKPENGEGEQAYKRVTQTFEDDDKYTELFVLFYTKPRSIDSEETIDHLIVTYNHLFFVKGRGWKQACELMFGEIDSLEISDGSKGYFWKLLWLCETEIKNVAWFENNNDGLGYDVDFRTYPYSFGKEYYMNDHAVSASSGGMSRPVFSIEVEDYHTYYVGSLTEKNLGVLVHDTSK